MKKIITAWLIVAALLSLPVTTYAQDQTEGSIEVSYEYTAPSDDGGDDADDDGDDGGGSSDNGDDNDVTTYMLNIPARVTLVPNEAVPITAPKNDIAMEKR